MIITLCGSARFEKAWHRWNEKLTLDGHVVLSMSVFPSQKEGIKEWYTEAEKCILDAVHLDKIDISDAIFVIDTDGTETYIGDSTMNEIKHAAWERKKIIFASRTVFESPLGDSPVRES